MDINLSEIRKRTIPVSEYLDKLEEPFREKFSAQKQSYALNREAVSQLKKSAERYVVVAFSAKWCKDCAANIPILALLSEATGLEVRIFGGLMKDPLSHTRKWRIPPSPPEAEKFHVDKIPLIILYSKEGNEVGRIVEKPQEPTLEGELLKIISESAHSL